MFTIQYFLKFVIPVHISTLGIGFGGISAMLSGSKETTNTTDRSKQEKSEKETQTQTSSQKSSSEKQAASSSLDDETIALVKELVGDLSTGVSDADSQLMNDLAALIAERASGAQEDVSAQISPIISDARLQGEQKLQQLQTQLAQQAGGSTANTLVASSTAVGRANLESQLARTEGELRLAGRQAVTDELSAAVQGVGTAEQSSVNNLVNLLNVLKGAEVEQTQTGQQQTESEAELVRVLDALVETQGRTDSTKRGLNWSLEGTFGNT